MSLLGAACWFVGTAVVSSLLGYLIHRLAHWPKAGIFYAMHMEHHRELYPPHEFLSEEYKSAGVASFRLWFVPIITVVVAAFILWLPTWYAVAATASLGIISALDDYLHDQFHLTGSRLVRFRWFRRLRALHLLHHRNMRKNYGIFSFVLDRMLGSFVAELRRRR